MMVEPVQFRAKFSPTLFVPSKKKEKYKTLDGRSVAPMEFLTARDAREFIKTYDGVEGLKYMVMNVLYISI